MFRFRVANVRSAFLLALAATAIGFVAFGRSAHSADPPNVILMMADDLGWGDVGFRGREGLETPHLDAMAKNGLVFDRFYSASSVCSPTRGSCLTGRHPHRYGVTTANAGHLREREVTLAEAMSARGYATGHFGKWHLGTMTPDFSGKGRGRKPEKNFMTPGDAGFERWFSTEYAVATWDPYDRANAHGKYDVRALYWEDGKNLAGDAAADLTGCDSKLIVDRADAFVRGAVAQDRPFFVVVWFHTPHKPIVGGPEYLERYADLPEDVRHYFAVVTAMDEQIGRLRRTLRELDVADDTMLWFASDNGPEGNPGPSGRSQGTAGPFRGRKRSLYEGGIRVPAILEWPERIAEPRRTSMPAVTSDYFPTIAAVLNEVDAGDTETDANDAAKDTFAASTARPSDGVSLLPLIDGKSEVRDSPIGFRFGQQQAWSGERFKFVRNGSKSRPRHDNGKTPFARRELYDLIEDPGETTNVIDRHPEIAAEMEQALDVWLASCDRSAAGED